MYEKMEEILAIHMQKHQQFHVVDEMDDDGNLNQKSSGKLVEFNVLYKEPVGSRKQAWQDNLFVFMLP